MPLTNVTITGADEAIDPQRLLELSDRFPFVEWGILFSANRLSVPRYPDRVWVRGLSDLAITCPNRMALSAHFCGTMARETATGKFVWLRTIEGMLGFERIQLNGSFPVGAQELCALMRLIRLSPLDFILQARTLDELIWCDAIEDDESSSISVLFDGSGGRGIEPASWPDTPGGLHLGFAGGITPDNAVRVVEDIGKRDYPFWIDMETGVRTDDQFDLMKVTAALEALEPFVDQSSRYSRIDQ